MKFLFREQFRKIQPKTPNWSVHGRHASRPSFNPTHPIGGGPLSWVLVGWPKNRFKKTGAEYPKCPVKSWSCSLPQLHTSVHGRHASRPSFRPVLSIGGRAMQ